MQFLIFNNHSLFGLYSNTSASHQTYVVDIWCHSKIRRSRELLLLYWVHTLSDQSTLLVHILTPNKHHHVSDKNSFKNSYWLNSLIYYLLFIITYKTITSNMQYDAQIQNMYIIKMRYKYEYKLTQYSNVNVNDFCSKRILPHQSWCVTS